MPTTKSTPRTIVALKMPRPVGALITFASGIVTAMTGNPAFPSPVPALSLVTAAMTALQTAETAALARTKGATATRDEKRKALVVLIEQLRAYVQATADASPENGASIVGGSGYPIRKTPNRAPRTFTPTAGAVSGSVKLYAATAGPRSAYLWQYSVDGGKTWVAAAATLQARTTIAGLTPGAMVQFRYQPVDKTGPGDWSQIVSFIVK